jgi:iron complex outermembrane receptor protein
MKKLFVWLFLTAMCGWAYADEITLEPIVVTPDRTSQEEALAPSNVTVISQEEIQDSGAKTVGELLDSSLGVYIHNEGVNSKTDVADIRGFADTAVSNVLVLVDGRKINTVDMSGPDLTQIPVETIDRIEVIRGADSVLYGNNAVGGVINIITKKGEGQATGSVEYDGGSYGVSTENINVGGSEKGLSYQMNQKYSNTDGYRTDSYLLAKDYDGKFSYSLTDALTINSGIVWHQDNYGAPGALSATDIATFGRRSSSFPNNTNYASSLDKTFSLGVDDKTIAGDLSVDASYRNQDTYAYLDYGGEPSTIKSNITTLSILGKDVYKGVVFDHDFQTVAGVDYYNSQEKILEDGEFPANLIISKDEIGVYDQNTFWVTDKLSLNAGYRYEYAQYTFNDIGNDAYTIKNAHAPVGGSSIKYEYAPGSNVHAGVQQTFRFLTTDEWYDPISIPQLNTNLKQQTGIQYEVGIKHNLNDITSVTVTPYWIDNKNEIYYDPNIDYYMGSNNNYGHTRRIGIEFGQETDLLKILKPKLDKLAFNTSFTYQDPVLIGGPYNGKTIPMVPNTQATAGFDVGFLKHFIFTVNEKFTGQEYASDDFLNQAGRTKQYWTTDVKLSYKLKYMELFVGVDNIFNEFYNDYTLIYGTYDTDKYYYPAPGRTVFGGIKLKF